jgi:hypothetical protein
MSQETIVLIIAAVTGIVGMPIIDWAKKAFSVDGKAALGVAVAVSFVLALVVTLTNGQIAGDLVSPEQVAQAFSVVFASATLFFKAIQADK